MLGFRERSPITFSPLNYYLLIHATTQTTKWIFKTPIAIGWQEEGVCGRKRVTVASHGLTVLADAWCPRVIMNCFCFHCPKYPGLDDRLHGHPNQKEPLKVVWLIAHSFLYN